MNTKEAYGQWAATYDTVVNKTRDMEGIALRTVLKDFEWNKVLELGCGTGKNSVWLAEKAGTLVATDFSMEMLQLAKQKVNADHVVYQEADITRPWNFDQVNLITCSLVLEHIEDLGFIFSQAAQTLEKGGLLYICELHPYKQYQGSRAKYERDGNVVELEYFLHHTSDFFRAAEQTGFSLTDLQEWFDENNSSLPPRLISLLFKKK